VIFSTGHHAQSHPDGQSPKPTLEDSTRVVYMPGRDLRSLAQQWLDEGLPSDFPCAIVSRAAQPASKSCIPRLRPSATPHRARASLLIAGWAVRESRLAFRQ